MQVKLYDNSREVCDYEMHDEPREGDVIRHDGKEFIVQPGRVIIDGKAHWTAEAPARSAWEADATQG